MVRGIVVDALLGDAGTGHASVNLEWRPGKQPGLDLIGKHVGIAGRLVDQLSHFARCLMVSVAVGDLPTKTEVTTRGRVMRTTRTTS